MTKLGGIFLHFSMQPDYLVVCAGIIYMLAFLITDQIILRGMLLFGSVFYISYYATVADEPLWAAIITNSGISLANLVGLGLLIFRRSRLSIPRAHADIYPFFSPLPPGDFRELIRMADRRVLADDAVLTREDEPVDTLYFVLDGKTTVHKRGDTFSLPKGTFIGEIGYMTGRSATATVTLAAGSEILSWDVARLRRKAVRNARFELALDAMISKDLAVKVAAAGAPSS